MKHSKSTDIGRLRDVRTMIGFEQGWGYPDGGSDRRKETLYVSVAC